MNPCELCGQPAEQLHTLASMEWGVTVAHVCLPCLLEVQAESLAKAQREAREAGRALSEAVQRLGGAK